MTPAEIDRFIEAQLNMGARIALKASRARMAAAAFTNVKGLSGPSLGDRIIAALDRPGVAPSARPISRDGAQTFHFALTTVSRTSDFAKRMKNDVPGKAGDHMGYMEREGAAETIDPEVRRDAEAIDREAWAILGGQAYIERPDAAEVMPDGRTLASFGNIAATLEERIAYWRALEEAAPKPKTHGVITDRTKDPAFWDRVDKDPTAPSLLRSTPPWIALPVPASTPDADRLNKPIPVVRVSDKEAIAIAQYAAKHRSRAKGTGLAVDFDPGRGGRIQNRIIVELPHELTAGQRLEVAKAFCDKHFVEGREKPLPHWCVIHRPDHHNDSRNTHMHIVFSERPAAKVSHPTTGENVWDFEVVEEKKDKHRNKWSIRPLEQNPDRSLQDRSWVKKARKSYANIANAALAAAGKSKIYDARTYKEMGIDLDPRKRINGKDYVNEKKGISTNAGTEPILEQWRREEVRLSARHPSFDPDKNIWMAFNREIKRWERSTTSTKFKLMSLRHEWNIAQAHRKYHLAEAAANALIMRKIKSKLAPPLATDAQTARDVTAYLRMFKIDLIDKHTAAANQWRKNERYLLASLKQAQTADPKKATVSAFMDGAAIMQAMAGRMNEASVIAASNPHLTMPELVRTSIATIQESVDEKRAINSALRIAEKAREGVIELYPVKALAAAPKTEAAKPAPSAAITPAAVASTSGPTMRTDAPRPAMAEAQPSTAPTSHMPAPSSVPRYAADGAGRFELRPEGKDPNAPPPPPPPRNGDERSMTFLSDTGAPVQRRVYSPARIKETERRATAIIEAAEKRRALHAATYEAAKAAEERFARTKAYMDGTAERRARAAEAAGSAGPTAPTGDAARTAERPPSDVAGPSKRPEPVTSAPVPTPEPPGVTPVIQPAPQGRAANAATPSAAPKRPEAVSASQSASTASSTPDTPPSPTGRTETPPPSSIKPAEVDVPQPAKTPAAIDGARLAPPTPLLTDTVNVYQPSDPSTTDTSRTDPANRPQPGTTIDIADIEVTDAPPKKKKLVLTPEQLRQRTLLAAKNRGRGR